MRYVLILLLFSFVLCNRRNHKYNPDDEVLVLVSNVGPYQNKQERYPFFSLPFCNPENTSSHDHKSFKERFLGIDLALLGIDLKFKQNQSKQLLCSKVLSKEDEDKFKLAVQNDYWYQMFIDDLSVPAAVGILQDNTPFIFTHRTLSVSFNNDRIIKFNATIGSEQKLVANVTLDFTFDVTWYETSMDYADRFDTYLEPDLFQHRVHWFSIFNSFMMVVFLVGFVLMILSRTLKKDLARYSKDDEIDDIERSLTDEYGWKQIHGDVFRSPPHLSVFTSLIGSGYHLATSALFCIIFAIVGELYTNQASLMSTCIFLYTTISPINGYFGGSLYSRWHGKNWIKQLLIATLICPGATFAVACVVNFVAALYRASGPLSLGVAFCVVCIILFIILPLNFVGTILGRALLGDRNFPCRVNAVPRPIPEKRWFMNIGFMALAGGLLPFGCIFIEMYFVFVSFWAYKIYYVYGFMLLVFIMLAAVTMCVAVVCTYFLLNAEDYRWQWTSFFTGASISIYVYLYSIYYFFFRTKMYGLFQITFYFGYMALFCFLLGIMCGTFGFIGASLFINTIYTTVKVD